MARVPDLDRLKDEYARRDADPERNALYSLQNSAHKFAVRQRQRAAAQLLQRHGRRNLTQQTALEVGCGSGGVLTELLELGACSERLHGTDLLLRRVQAARQRVPNVHLTCADAQFLPYSTATFALVLQFTVFTSVLDDGVRANLVAEMLRVLKPDGLILWYDFWLNPTNPHTRGIRPSEIRHLFPGCTYDFRRITLAPPIARTIVPISWTLALLLEKLTIFNSHYLVAIRKPQGTP